MSKSPRNKTREIPDLSQTQTEFPDQERECEECGRTFKNDRGLTMHQIRAHGYKDMTPSGERPTKIFRLALDQTYRIIEYLKKQKERIHDKRMTKTEVLQELRDVFDWPLKESHIANPAKVAGIEWPRGFKTQQVIIKPDTRTLLTLALAVEEIYEKLKDLLGGTPKIIIQLKEQLQAELRKEQEAKQQANAD